MDMLYLMRRQVDAVVEATRRWIGSPAECSVLDLGCSDGDAEPFLAEHFARVVAMDIDETRIRTAQQRHCLANVQFVHLPQPRPLPCDDGEFDVAVAFSLLHHLRRPERLATLAAVRRAVRPGGLVAMLEYNPFNPAALGLVLFGPEDHGSRPLVTSMVASLMRDGGLEVLDSRFLLWFPASLSVLSPLEDRLGRVPMGAKHVTFARRPAEASS